MSLLTPTRRHLMCQAAFGSAAVLSGCSGDSQFMRASDTQSDGYPTVEALRFFANDLSARTDGRLNISIFSGAQLGSENDTLELAQFGGIDFIRVNTTPLNVIVKETLVPALPFVFRSTNHMRAAMDGLPGRQILDSLEPHGLIGLCFYDSGARSFYTTNRLIQEPADLKGMKIRVQSSDLLVSMVEALGGDATPMSYGEVYQGLMQGVIDGAENNWPSYQSSRHYEVARYFSDTRHVMAPEVLAMSRRTWRRLSDEDQQHVREAATASVPVMRSIWDARVNSARAAVMASGITFTDNIDHEAFVERVGPVWKKFAHAPILARLVQDIQAIESSDA